MSNTNYVDVFQPNWKIEIGISEDKVVSIDWREMPKSKIGEPYKLRLYKILMDAVRIIRPDKKTEMADFALSVQPKWISVEERLPEANTPILILGEWYPDSKNELWVHRIWDANISERCDMEAFFEYYKVTHWMPLLEQPRKEELDDINEYQAKQDGGGI